MPVPVVWYLPLMPMLEIKGIYVKRIHDLSKHRVLHLVEMSYLLKLNTFLKLLFQINIEIKTNIKAQSRTSKRPRPRDT